MTGFPYRNIPRTPAAKVRFPPLSVDGPFHAAPCMRVRNEADSGLSPSAVFNTRGSVV